jgi:hypothetical protein
MNKYIQKLVHFASSVLGNKKEIPSVVPMQGEDAFTSCHSQPHMLRSHMGGHHMTHAETVTATLERVRVEPDIKMNGERVAHVYFCPLQAVKITKRLKKGDGKAIPADVTLKGIAMPKNFGAGYYNLKNIVLTSNGTIQICATADTEWELVNV